MTKAAIQHEQKEFIDTILNKVRRYSRLVEIKDLYTRDKELIKEQEEVMADIENSLYRRLDEVGDSE